MGESVNSDSSLLLQATKKIMKIIDKIIETVGRISSKLEGKGEIGCDAGIINIGFNQ